MLLAGLIVAIFWTPAAAQAPLSTARETLLKARDTFRECALCRAMVAIPPGMFLMGSPDNEPERDDTEGLQRRVTIARPFALGKLELTVDQFAA